MPPVSNVKIYKNLKNQYHKFDVKHFKSFTRYNDYDALRMSYEVEMRFVYDRFLNCWNHDDPKR